MIILGSTRQPPKEGLPARQCHSVIFISLQLPLYSPCCKPLYNVLLHTQIKNHYREDRYDGKRHKPWPVHAELPFGPEHLKNNGSFHPGVQENIRRNEIVPYPHGIKNNRGCRDRLHKRKNTRPILHPSTIAASVSSFGIVRIYPTARNTVSAEPLQ